jgi:putative ABC transport system permease protein
MIRVIIILSIFLGISLKAEVSKYLLPTPKEVKVTGITENYIFNYIYMTPTLYQSLYNVSGDLNVLMLKLEDGANTSDVSSRLLQITGINSVTMNTDEVEQLNTVINSLYFKTSTLI